MAGTFGNCQLLVTAPAIPDHVADISGIFSNCRHLKTAPVIPNSVNEMRGAFMDCVALTGSLIINTTNLSEQNRYENCLLRAVTDGDARLELSGRTDITTLYSIKETGGKNSNIIVRDGETK